MFIISDEDDSLSLESCSFEYSELENSSSSSEIEVLRGVPKVSKFQCSNWPKNQINNGVDNRGTYTKYNEDVDECISPEATHKIQNSDDDVDNAEIKKCEVNAKKTNLEKQSSISTNAFKFKIKGSVEKLYYQDRYGETSSGYTTARSISNKSDSMSSEDESTESGVETTSEYSRTYNPDFDPNISRGLTEYFQHGYETQTITCEFGASDTSGEGEVLHNERKKTPTKGKNEKIFTHEEHYSVRHEINYEKIGECQRKIKTLIEKEMTAVSELSKIAGELTLNNSGTEPKVQDESLQSTQPLFKLFDVKNEIKAVDTVDSNSKGRVSFSEEIIVQMYPCTSMCRPARYPNKMPYKLAEFREYKPGNKNTFVSLHDIALNFLLHPDSRSANIKCIDFPPYQPVHAHDIPKSFRQALYEDSDKIFDNEVRKTICITNKNVSEMKPYHWYEFRTRHNTFLEELISEPEASIVTKF